MGKALIAFGLAAMPLWGASAVTLVNEVVTVPAGGSHSYELMLHQHVARLSGTFSVRSGPDPVRVSIARKVQPSPEIAPSYQWIYATRARMAGEFQYTFHDPGDYVLLVDAEPGARAPAEVVIEAELDFDAEERPRVVGVPPRRRAAIIAISLSVFFVLAAFCYARLRPVFKSLARRNSGPPRPDF
jgi:hypothetical protein